MPQCHKQRAVDSAIGIQLRDNLKQLLSIRNACPEIRWGTLENVDGSGGVLRFQRVLDDTGVQDIFNFSNETVFVPEAEI